MYQIQADKLAYFNKQINNYNRKITYRFTLNDKELHINKVVDNLTLTTDSGLEQYGVGASLVTQLQMSVIKEVLIIPKDKITIEIGLDIYNEVTQQWETIHTPMGVFYVDALEEQGIKKSIKAYDGMYKLNKGYFPTAKHTTTQAIANDIATTNGYKLKGVTNVAINNEQLQGKTCIEMLSLVASAMGTNVRISRDGSTIEFVEPFATDLTFDESHLSTATLDDTTSYNITKLRINYSDQVTNDEGVVTDEGYYTVGSGADSNTLELSNPLLKGKQSQATNVLNKIKKLNGYKRFDTTMPFADYRIEPLDLVTYSKAGVSYLVPILYMKMTLSYRGISVETQSPTLAPTKSEFSFKGTLTQKVESLYTDIIQVKQLTANKVTTDQLEATVATIEKLYATKAEIGELVAGSIVVEELKAQIVEIDKAIINKADITDLNATHANIETLKANVAEIGHLIADSILAEIIQSGSISSELLNVKDGFIKDAMIGSLSASKIDSGVINTNNVLITSDNGNMTLQGNLLQFKDKTGKVRIQIGQDTKGNYTFTLYDSTGKGVLINQEGIQSSNAIKDGLIVDAKISDHANISGSKLNISSLYDSMNADGSKTLKASKVYLDDKEQTLDMSFKEMTTKQDDLEESMNTAITDISVAQGQISQLIQDTTITTSSGTTKLKDAYNSTKSTVDSHSTQIGKMESTIDANTGEITSTKNEVATIKASLDEIKLSVKDVETKVEDINIGVRNYVRDYKFEKSDVWKRSSTSTTSIDTANNYGILTGTTSNPYLYQNFENGLFKVGDTLTLQYEIKCEGVSANTGTNSFLIRTQLTGYTSSGTYVRDVSIFGKHESNGEYADYTDWTKVVKTVTITGEENFDYLALRLYARNFKGKIYFRNVKLELGNKATDLTAAPEDIETAVSIIETRVSSAEQKITSDAIVSTVTSSQTYKDTLSGKVDTNKIVSTINQTAEAIKINASKIQLEGAVTAGESGRFVKIENANYGVFNGSVNCMRFGYKTWNGWDGVPEFLMGYKGMRYSTSANTGEDASYFGMQTWGRGVKDNNTYAYHDLYYRSDKYANQHHIRFTEDGLMQLKSLKRLELMGGSNVYVQVDTSGGLTLPQGIKSFGVSDTIWLQGSNFGIVWGKYSGKEEYNLRPTNNNLTDLGHASYRYRTIYATNGTVNTSDISLKENIVSITNNPNKESATLEIKDDNLLVGEDFYQFVKELPLYSYDYKSESHDRSLHNIGFIAQDIANTPVGDEFVFKGEDGIYQYNMQGYVGVLAVALQTAIQKIEKLEMNHYESRSFD